MKKTTIFIFAFSLFVFSACDDAKNNTNNTNNTNNINNINNTNNTNNTNNPQLVQYSNTGCKGTLKTLDESLFHGFECVAWEYDGSDTLVLRHVNALFNCCPDEVLGLTGVVSFADGVFQLTESDNGGMCNCMCPYDLVYTLSGVIPGQYSVDVDPFSPPVTMDLSVAVDGWFCIDRLLDMMYNSTVGERGYYCESSEDCMGGEGYCYGY